VPKSSIKPTALSVLLEQIPQELKDLNRWVLWSHEGREPRPNEITWTKVPKGLNGYNINATDPKKWCSFSDASAALANKQFDGLGFALGEGIHGIDLDDCIDPVTGAMSELAKETLARVKGYAEISPSGTGLKILTRTNLQYSSTVRGVELYCDRRFFCLTGRVFESHLSVASDIQDIEWLISTQTNNHVLVASSADPFTSIKLPLEGWDLERVTNEILVHLKPECSYKEWLDIGMALFHQGGGDLDWLDAWDVWSSKTEDGRYRSGECEEKWATFSSKNTSGREQITLATALYRTKQLREEYARAQVHQLLLEWKAQIHETVDVSALKEIVAPLVESNTTISELDRKLVAGWMRAQAKNLGLTVSPAEVLSWITPPKNSKFSDLSANGTPLCTIDNLQLLLDELGIVVRYNTIKKNVEINVPSLVSSRDNKDNVGLSTVLSECSKAQMPTKHVLQYLIAIADKNLYNPVVSWITSKPWDGVSRLNDFYDTVISNSPLKEMLLRKWLVQATAAAFSSNGIANQGVLTFLGPQNIGKTTWFQRLAPFHLDLILTGLTLDTKSKDSTFVALSHWIVELGEVDATFRKSDIAALKSFITQPVDKIRRPYAATESNFDRRTTFGATVNDDKFLHDPTGNRRFWVINVERFVLDHTIDMQQLWAEVFEIWKAGELWNLNQEEVAMVNLQNEDFTVVDPFEEILSQEFDWESDPGTWIKMTATMVLKLLGHISPTKAQTQSVGRALRKLNGDQSFRSNGSTLFPFPANRKQPPSFS
jgi:putative DNA primase/helicase